MQAELRMIVKSCKYCGRIIKCDGYSKTHLQTWPQQRTGSLK